MVGMTAPFDPPAEGNSRRFDSLEQEAFLNLWRTYDRLHFLEEELRVRPAKASMLLHVQLPHV